MDGPTWNSAERQQARSPGRRSGLCASLKSNSTLSLLRKGVYNDPKLASAEFWQCVLQNSTDDGSRPVLRTAEIIMPVLEVLP